MDTYEKNYKEALAHAREIHRNEEEKRRDMEFIFPELKESEDEKIRKALIKGFNECLDSSSYPKNAQKYWHGIAIEDIFAWLEKQGSEPNWCHHKVDLSNCSEEYRKAYYDGWNNCNQQHSQCKSDGNDVVKCLINGMKFYYEDNEEATWGTEKFSIKVKDILAWLEKQGEQKPAWSCEDETRLQACLDTLQANSLMGKVDTVMTNWLKSLKQRIWTTKRNIRMQCW